MKRFYILSSLVAILLALSLLVACTPSISEDEEDLTRARVATPVINPNGGTYTTAQTVAITTTTSGATIRYTTNGTTPSKSVGTIYSGPISVSSSMTVKAIAYKSGMTSSYVASATFTINVPTPTSGEWLYAIYLDGDNNLEPYGIMDVNEMEYGLYQLQQNNPTAFSKVKVIVLFDRTSGYDTTNGNWTDTRAFEVKPDSSSSETGTMVSTRIAIPTLNITTTSTTTELNMGDPANLNKFLAFCKTSYSYTNIALVLWDHGGGTREHKAAGWDDSNGGDCLYLDEIRQAISANYTSTDKLAVVGFDACLMGMAEVAYQFKDVVKYMSISPNTEGGYGWDYELMMKWMTVGITPLEVTNNIVKAYHDSTLTQTSETQTAVDLAYADSLKTAIDALAAAMYNENNKSALETTILSSIDFSQGDYTNYPFFEVGKFCASITASTTYSANLKTAAQNVINALSNIVTYAYANSAMGNYYGTGATVKKGLAIVFPVNKSTKASTYSSVGKWYTSRNMSATSTPYGNLIFCSFDNDGVVETWKELLEAWYDGGNTLTGDTY